MQLTTQHIDKFFGGTHPVKDLSIELQPGKITGIIGPNGSGKTTLVNLLTGMISIDHGSITLQSKTLTQIRSYQTRFLGISRTFQDIQLFEQMSVLDNLLLTLQQNCVFSTLFRPLSREAFQQAQSLLERVDLWEKRDSLAMNLSYGQRKLVEMTRILAMDTPVMIFDEPFAGLSQHMIQIVSDILKQLRSQNKTIALIEHNMHLIQTLSDHVIFLDNGRLIAQGTPDYVFSLPETLEAYLGD